MSFLLNTVVQRDARRSSQSRRANPQMSRTVAA
jgi:hypothetical protein